MQVQAWFSVLPENNKNELIERAALKKKGGFFVFMKLPKIELCSYFLPYFCNHAFIGCF
jgi:hypothetical protein